MTTATIREIPLTRGMVALVDAEDYERISSHKWQAWINKKLKTQLFYAIGRTKGTRKTIWMHREVLRVPCGVQVDHINGNGLDNRKQNLRPCSHFGNTQNARPKLGKKLKGIHKSTRGRGWYASIRAYGKRHYLGYFANQEEAALAYDGAAKKFHGQFARLNFPEGRQCSA